VIVRGQYHTDKATSDEFFFGGVAFSLWGTPLNPALPATFEPGEVTHIHETTLGYKPRGYRGCGPFLVVYLSRREIREAYLLENESPRGVGE
jgi:hypothetical protein